MLRFFFKLAQNIATIITILLACIFINNTYETIGIYTIIYISLNHTPLNILIIIINENFCVLTIIKLLPQ